MFITDGKARPGGPPALLCGVLLAWLLLLSTPARAQGPFPQPSPEPMPSPWILSRPSVEAPLQRALAEGRLDEARALLMEAPEGADTDLSRGVLAELSGDPETARALYLDALRQRPAEAAFRIGTLELKAGRPREAAVWLRRAVRADPSHAFAEYHLALALEALGQPVEALEHADRALALDPAETYTLVRSLTRGRAEALEVNPVNLFRTRALLLRGRLARDEAALQAAPDLAPSDPPEAWLGLARQALARGDVGAGAVWLQAYLESAVEPTGVESDLAVWGPGSLAGVRTLRYGVDSEGRVHRVGGGDLGVRLPHGAYGMSVDRDGTVRAWVGDDLREVGRLPFTGEGVVLAGFRSRGDDGEAWEMLPPEAARLVQDLPFLAPAEAAARLAPLTEGPLAPLALARLGALSYAAGDLADARKQWERLRELQPEMQFPVLNLASVALLDRRYAEAEALLAELSDRSLPHRLRVSLALARGQAAEAEAAAGAYQERFPHDPWPAFARAELAASQGRTDEALAMAERMLEANPGLVEARYLLVRLLGRRGEVQRQREELERVLELDPFPYRARRMLADLLERLGETAEAVELYRAYLASPEALVYETEEWVQVDVKVKKLTEGR